MKWLIGLGFALMASEAKAQLPNIDAAQFATTPIALTDNTRGITIKLPSRSPTDYGDAICGEVGGRVELSAQLFLPNDKRNRHSAIILVPGSGV